ESEGKQQVLEFVRSLGFRSVDVGPLAMARALEGMGLLNISLNMSHGLPWQSAWRLAGPLGDAARDPADSAEPGAAQGIAYPLNKIIAMVDDEPTLIGVLEQLEQRGVGPSEVDI